MIRKLLAAAFGAFFATYASAANLPLLTGPVDPANELAQINQTILSINAGVNGLLGTTLATTTTTLTTIQTLATYTINGGVLASAGQALHLHVWGVNSADANVKTLTFSFGGSTQAFIVTGSGNVWDADLYIVKSGASTQIAEGKAQSATTLILPQQSAWTITDTAAITLLVQGTAATAGTMSLVGSTLEQIK